MPLSGRRPRTGESLMMRRRQVRSAMVRHPDITPISAEDRAAKSSYLDATDQVGFTLLHKAVMTKQYKTVKQLIEKGADVNKAIKTNGMSAFLLAARHGDREAIGILLASENVNIDATDKGGWTALHHCSINNHLVIAEMLLYAGANPNIKGTRGESAENLAPVREMKELISKYKQNQTSRVTSESSRRCFLLPNKGGTVGDAELGLELEVTRSRLNSTGFFICTKHQAQNTSVQLGHSEVLLSHVYEFWPPNISFGSSATMTVSCMQTSKSDRDHNEVLLKLENGEEIIENKDKLPATRENFPPVTMNKHRFTVTDLCKIYVVSRLAKETYIIPMHGAEKHHSIYTNLRLIVPKNGLSSEACVSFQLYPVGAELVSQIQRQYEGMRSIGPVCEITHNDVEAITRRLVSMSIPLPPDYQSRRNSDSRLVIVSGTGEEEGGEQEGTEIIQKLHVKSSSSVQFLTRYLTWKVAVLVTNSLNLESLAEACISVRKFTHRRMQLVKHWVLYKQEFVGQYNIALVVAPPATGDTLVGEMMVNRGFSNARFFNDPIPQLICEGQTSHLRLLTTEQKSVSVTFFAKHKSVGFLRQTCNTGSRALRFEIVDSEHRVIIEGEI